MAHRIFVYGTLKRGMANYYLMTAGNAVLLGEAKLTRNYPLVVGGRWNVPYLLPAEGQGKVSSIPPTSPVECSLIPRCTSLGMRLLYEVRIVFFFVHVHVLDAQRH